MTLWGRWLLRAGLAAAACLLGAAPLDTGPQVPPGVFGFRSYDTSHGLTNPSVNALAQDKAGFLWVGTEDGLFRLEGQRMRLFGAEHGLPEGDTLVEDLGALPDGGLWVKMRTGLFHWDGHRFTRFLDVAPKGLRGGYGTVFPGGMIVRDEGFRRFLADPGGRWRELAELPQLPGLNCAWQAPDGSELLVCFKTALWRLSHGTWTHRDLDGPLTEKPMAVLRDRVGRFWIRTERTLLRVDGMDGRVTSVGDSLGLSTVTGASLVEDSAGRIWTNTAEGLVWMDDAGGHRFTDRDGLPEGGGNVLLVDQEGSLWVGGYGVHQQTGHFTWEGYTPRQGLPAHVVWCMARTRDGLIWAGTAGGLAVGGPTGWRTVPGTQQYQIATMREDGAGNLWAAPTLTDKEPTRLILRRAGQPGVSWVPLEGIPPGQTVSAMAWDPAGFLRLGVGGKGLHRLEARGRGWQVVPDPVPAWAGKPHLVQALARDAGGGWWIGGTEGLAFRRGDSWAYLPPTPGLPELDFLSIAPLPGEQAWVSCRSAKVIARVGLEGDHLKVLELIKPPHPLTDSPISDLAVEPSGVLWVASSHGLKRWDGTRMVRFDRSWGLPADDCSQNGIHLEPNGDIWLGLAVGAAHFRAGLWKGPASSPSVRILEAFDLKGTELPLGPGVIGVPYSQRTVTFRYVPQGYRLGEDTSFQVRMVGLEDTWRDTALPEARYPNLPAGKYRFEVRIKGTLSETTPVTGQDFVVLTPWWQTWWFYLGMAAGAAWVLLLGIRWRTRQMEIRMVSLEAQVHERTWELEEANKALEEASMVDPLTGLKNRRFLRLAMPEAEARCLRSYRDGAGEDLVFLLLDLDHFKMVNDTYGHAAGDEVLRQVAQVLRAACRESDLVIRWGGEEFLVVATGADRQRAGAIAANIREQVAQHTFTLPQGGAIQRTCSIGFCAFPLLPGDPSRHPWESAVEAADQCLYAAKKSGRDAWVGLFRVGREVPESLRDALPKAVRLLAEEGHFELRTSLEDPASLRWKG